MTEQEYYLSVERKLILRKEGRQHEYMGIQVHAGTGQKAARELILSIREKKWSASENYKDILTWSM